MVELWLHFGDNEHPVLFEERATCVLLSCAEDQQAKWQLSRVGQNHTVREVLVLELQHAR